MADQLVHLASLSGDPVLYILFAMSLGSVAVALERASVYARNRIDLAAFAARVVGFLDSGDLVGAQQLAASTSAAEARVVGQGLNSFHRGTTTVRELMESASVGQQQRLDTRLAVLGTVGSNAPFVGLLGTVIGIIGAFNDLSLDTSGGPSVVMAGISEALVATAFGLLVAIPAIVCFNYFKNRQKRVMGNIAQLKNILLAYVEDYNGEPV